ncbi:hypothetical protein PHYBOEH_003958 [Phytophthora boehmeriae]|uniref:Uncharacterized protein n=1 Tax=Phytophthora boehmeriae TaxID=109152 RepID=A0A8T1WQ13_9STRA|nr:hypothetical protein PHYBOEH_003958 [Phytophthora boehmeriae]
MAAPADEPKDPFDAKQSDREPFPSFEAALADAEGADEHESTLNWSIDTLAELKPVSFSPLAEQKKAHAQEVLHGASGFFEDETQYEILRTPLALRPPTAARNETLLLLTPSPSHPLDLHRRCRETIARCEARVRERQRKMENLQAVLPPRTPSQPLSDRQRQRATPPRPAKRNKHCAFTPNNEGKSPGMRPPTWSASPITMAGSSQVVCGTPPTPRFDAVTPSSLMTTPRNSMKQTHHSKQRLSFGLSPILFPSPEQERKSESEGEREDAPRESLANDTLSPSSAEASLATGEATTPVVSSNKENDEKQQQQEQDTSSSSHTTSSPSSTSFPSSPKKVVAPTRSSIPRRQQAFVAAIEAEASKTQPRVSVGVAVASPPPSILSLYQNAKRLGMSDPQAQREYVQRLRRGDDVGRPTRKHKR